MPLFVLFRKITTMAVTPPQPACFQGEGLVGAVGIGLKATLKIRKLFIPLDGKNAKNPIFAQPRYTPGTRRNLADHC